MVLLLQLSYLLPMLVLGVVSVRRELPHRRIFLLYVALIACMAMIVGFSTPKYFWHGVYFGAAVYAISLGIVWVGICLWRVPGRLQRGFRALAAVAWVLSVPSLIWALELVGGD